MRGRRGEGVRVSCAVLYRARGGKWAVLVTSASSAGIMEARPGDGLAELAGLAIAGWPSPGLLEPVGATVHVLLPGWASPS